ncbi:hypothetical protein T439DRAFT_353945 [Meredithblackwellia eburnea MCA 4105]
MADPNRDPLQRGRRAVDSQSQRLQRPAQRSPEGSRRFAADVAPPRTPIRYQITNPLSPPPANAFDFPPSLSNNEYLPQAAQLQATGWLPPPLPTSRVTAPPLHSSSPSRLPLPATPGRPRPGPRSSSSSRSGQRSSRGTEFDGGVHQYHSTLSVIPGGETPESSPAASSDHSPRDSDLSPSSANITIGLLDQFIPSNVLHPQRPLSASTVFEDDSPVSPEELQRQNRTGLPTNGSQPLPPQPPLPHDQYRSFLTRT